MDAWQKDGHICNPSQLYTLRRTEITEGPARGLSLIEVANAGGLSLDILPDNGLDIGQVRFRGTNMTFISKNGLVSPEKAQPFENEFLHYFPGGLVYTCGLRSAGPQHEDNGEWHPLHGRYHLQHADQVCSRVEDGCIKIEGTVRETALFGSALECRRTISISLEGAEIFIEDTVTNLTPAEEEFAFIYHCNFGWPLVSEKAHVVLPEGRKTTPRTPFAATGLGRECTFDPPTPGEEERVFFHEDMPREAQIINPDLKVSMSMTWSESLPILAHWRSMASGDYACGLEPGNCYIMGRKAERENGTLKVLAPYETVKTGVHFRFDTLA